MPVVKVIEIIGQSENSFEDAVNEAVKESSKTVKNIKSVWVKDLQAKVQDGRVTAYRACCKISFVVERK